MQGIREQGRKYSFSWYHVAGLGIVLGVAFALVCWMRKQQVSTLLLCGKFLAVQAIPTMNKKAAEAALSTFSILQVRLTLHKENT